MRTEETSELKSNSLQLEDRNWSRVVEGSRKNALHEKRACSALSSRSRFSRLNIFVGNKNMLMDVLTL